MGNRTLETCAPDSNEFLCLGSDHDIAYPGKAKRETESSLGDGPTFGLLSLARGLATPGLRVQCETSGKCIAVKYVDRGQVISCLGVS